MILVLALLMMLGACQPKSGVGDGRAPNLLLLVLDDVAHENFSVYGGEVPTPHIDALAASGMRFEQAFTPSAACTPSRFALITGRYPGSCTHPEFLDGNPLQEPYSISWNTPISEGDQTLHRVLGQAGYHTGYVGKFHIGALDFEDPSRNGSLPEMDLDMDPDSDEADALLAAHQEVLAARVRQLTGADYAAAIQWANPETYPLKALRTHHNEWIARAAMDFVSGSGAEQPFFLQVNLTTLHGPHHGEGLRYDPVFTPQGRMPEFAPYRDLRASVFSRLEAEGLAMDPSVPNHIRHYRSGTVHMDDMVGLLMESLEAAGLAENTLVLLVADHNLEPGKSSTYDKGTRVPFIASWPGVVKASSSNSTLVSFVDLLPTLASLAQSEADTYVGPGQSFEALLRGEAGPEKPLVYLEEGYTRAVRNQDFKYIATRYPASLQERILSGKQEGITHMGSGVHAFSYISMEYFPGYFDPDQLYDIQADPYEQHNLAGDPRHQEALSLMKGELEGKLDGFAHPFDLDDTAFFATEAYRKATALSRSRGTDFIPWWDRELDFPPAPKTEQP